MRSIILIITIAFSLQGFAINDVTFSCGSYSQVLKANPLDPNKINGGVAITGNFKKWVGAALNVNFPENVKKHCHGLSTKNVQTVTADIQKSCESDCLSLSEKKKTDKTLVKKISEATGVKPQVVKTQHAKNFCKNSCEHLTQGFKMYTAGFSNGEGRCPAGGGDVPMAEAQD